MFQAAPALHIDRGVGIDQDIRDRLILQKRLERPQPQQFVEDVIDQMLGLGGGEELLLLVEERPDGVAYLQAQLGAGRLLDHAQIEQLQKPLVDAHAERQMVLGRLTCGARRRAR